MEDHQEKKLLFVSGELSGIQETVFTISSKGALKSLRARSFMLELLTWHISYELLQLTGVAMNAPQDYLIRLMPKDETRPGIIYSGGGAFALLLDYKEDIENEINRFRDYLNAWALMEFCGSLFIAMHTQKITANKLLNNFQEVWRAQTDAIEAQKKKKFWTPHGEMLDYLLKPRMPVQTKAEQHCQITGRDDLPATELPPAIASFPNNAITVEPKTGFPASRSAYHLWTLGEKLARIGTGSPIYRYPYDKVDETRHSGYLSFPTAQDNQYAIYSFDDFQIAPELTWRVGAEIHYAYFVTKVSDLTEFARNREYAAALETRPDIAESQIQPETASFIGLSAAAVGADMIGALRMDVDNLGELFAEIDSHRGLALTSFHYNYFFRELLNRICSGDACQELPGFQSERLFSSPGDTGDAARRNVTVIYSGGDDLFIVGAWNEIIELAFDIQKALACYCAAQKAQDPNLNLTPSICAGITIHNPKYPLYQMARRSKAAETCAKSDIDEGDGSAKKNRVCMFHDENKLQRQQKLNSQNKPYRYMLSMKWGTAETDILDLMRELKTAGRIEEPINGKALFKLDAIPAQTIEKWFRILSRFQRSGLLALPTMARVLSELRDNLTPNLYQALIDKLYRQANDNLPHLHVVLNWLSFLRREH